MNIILSVVEPQCDNSVKMEDQQESCYFSVIYSWSSSHSYKHQAYAVLFSVMLIVFILPVFVHHSQHQQASQGQNTSLKTAVLDKWHVTGTLNTSVWLIRLIKSLSGIKGLVIQSGSLQCFTLSSWQPAALRLFEEWGAVTLGYAASHQPPSLEQQPSLQLPSLIVR